MYFGKYKIASLWLCTFKNKQLEYHTYLLNNNLQATVFGNYTSKIAIVLEEAYHWIFFVPMESHVWYETAPLLQMFVLSTKQYKMKKWFINYLLTSASSTVRVMRLPKFLLIPLFCIACVIALNICAWVVVEVIMRFVL